ncbi:hypothetical protein [Sulfurimonas sp.]
MYFFFVLIMFSSSLFAQQNYIDTFHQNISQKVGKYADDLDNFLSSSETQDEKPTQNHIKKSDTFFKNDKYMKETRDTFIALDLGYNMDSLESNHLFISLDAHIPLYKLNKKYNLFINNLTRNDTNSPPKSPYSDITQKEQTTEIGLNYFRDISKNFRSKYALGIRGLSLFTSAQYGFCKNFQLLDIDAVEIFQYNSRNIFSENSNLYLDTKVHGVSFFRTTLYRGTSSNASGMDYGLSVSKYILFNHSGIYLSQIFSSNTSIHGFITNYTTLASYKKSIWRKWFFYTLSPSLIFDKSHHYKTEYAMKFLLQSYFRSGS